MTNPDDPHGPEDEIDGELTDDVDTADTLPEEMEYLGSYSSIPAYLRGMLEPEVSPGCAWILDHLDFRAVQRRWESDGSRLVLERGHVYRVRCPESDEAGAT